MKIDLHVHSSEYSNCASSTAVEVIESAIARGLDAIGFSNHNKLVPAEHLEALNKQYAPFKIFSGLEMDVEGEHVLVYGIQDSALENIGWSYKDLHEFVHAYGGFMAVAHPLRGGPLKLNVQEYPPHAIELHSMNTYQEDTQEIQGIIEGCETRALHNSDAHEFRLVGVYHNVLDDDVSTDQELAAAFCSGAYQCSAIEDSVEEERIEAIRRDDIARDVISKGGNAKEFLERSGYPANFFRRVERGLTTVA
ncbi:MAG: PHP domain-containing protein [Planctomycetes bacterium]|nr:PHP domain-containing protein [Planctomycetota bacterium]